MENSHSFGGVRPFKSRFTRVFKIFTLVLLGAFLSRDLVWAVDYGVNSNKLKKDQDRTATGFAPAYVKEQQEKHTQFVQERNDALVIRKSVDTVFTEKVREVHGQQMAAAVEETTAVAEAAGRSGAGEESLMRSSVDKENGILRINFYKYDERGKLSSIDSHNATEFAGNKDVEKIVSAAQDLGDGSKGTQRNLDRSSITNGSRSSVTFFNRDSQATHSASNLDSRTQAVGQVTVFERGADGETTRALSYNTENTVENQLEQFTSGKSLSRLLEGQLNSVESYEKLGVGRKAKNVVMRQIDKISGHITKFIYNNNKDLTNSVTENADGKVIREGEYTKIGETQPVISKIIEKMRGTYTTYDYSSDSILKATKTHNRDGAVLRIDDYKTGADGEARVSSSKDTLTGLSTAYTYDDKNKELMTITQTNEDGVKLVESEVKRLTFNNDRIVKSHNLMDGTIQTYTYKEGGSSALEKVITTNDKGLAINESLYTLGAHDQEKIASQTDLTTGNKTAFLYSESGALTQSTIKNEAGVLIETNFYKSDPAGSDLLVKTVDELSGNTTDFVHNDDGILLTSSVTSAEGVLLMTNQFTEGVDATDHLTITKDELAGIETVFSFDEKSGLLTQAVESIIGDATEINPINTWSPKNKPTPQPMPVEPPVLFAKDEPRTTDPVAPNPVDLAPILEANPRIESVDTTEINPTNTINIKPIVSNNPTSVSGDGQNGLLSAGDMYAPGTDPAYIANNPDAIQLPVSENNSKKPTPQPLPIEPVEPDVVSLAEGSVQRSNQPTPIDPVVSNISLPQPLPIETVAMEGGVTSGVSSGQVNIAAQTNAAGSVLSVTYYKKGVDGRSVVDYTEDMLTGNITTYTYYGNGILAQASTVNKDGAALSTTVYESGVDGQARQKETIDHLTGNITNYRYDQKGIMSGSATQNTQGQVIAAATFEKGIDGQARIADQTDLLTGQVTRFQYSSSNNQMTSSTTFSAEGVSLSATNYEL